MTVTLSRYYRRIFLIFGRCSAPGHLEYFKKIKKMIIDNLRLFSKPDVVFQRNAGFPANHFKSWKAFQRSGRSDSIFWQACRKRKKVSCKLNSFHRLSTRFPPGFHRLSTGNSTARFPLDRHGRIC